MVALGRAMSGTRGRRTALGAQRGWEAARRGSYFSEGGVLPFTTLKRFCSNLSPQ